jgi:hypothetical protein
MEKEKNIDLITFPEKIVLLALNDKGWFGNSEQRIKFGLAGALLFELDKAGEIDISEDLVRLTGTKETGDKVMDSALDSLRKSKKTLTLNKSIQRIVYKSGLKWKAILKTLVNKNILRMEESRFLWIIYQDKYPLVNSEIKKKILDDLDSKLNSGTELSPEDLMLLVIMKTCRMIDKNFLLQEHFLKVRLKIKEIIEFKEPLTVSSRKIKGIQVAIYRSIMASNVTIHI